MFDPMEFARRVKGAREAVFLTQEDLASQIGVDKSTVAAWERGTKGGKPLGAPDAKNVLKLADAVRRNAHWLLNGDGDDAGSNSLEAAIQKLFDIVEERLGRRPKGLDLAF